MYHNKEDGVFGLRPDVAIARQFDDGRVYIETKSSEKNPEFKSFADARRKGVDLFKDLRVPKVSDVLDFPELFKEYPQLRNIPVIRLDGLDSGAIYLDKGVDDKPTIAIGYTYNPKQFQSSLLHELQHAVQYIEGFPTGANPDTIIGNLDPRRTGKDAEARAIELYRRVYGETEARNVQRRFEDPNLRRFVPTQTRDVKDSDLILTSDDVDDVADFDAAMSGPQASRPTGLSPDEVLDEIYGQDTSISVGPFALPHAFDHKVKLELLPDINDPEGAINIAGIVSTGERGEGFGTRAMKLITGKADENNLALTLEVDPVSRGGKPDLSKEDLVVFYEREGFIKVNKNYDPKTKTTTYEPIDPETNKDRFGSEWVDEMYRPPVDGRMQSLPRGAVAKKAEGGVISLVDVARGMTRGPRGVESLVPVARNMNRSMLG